ncbi:MAG: excisionase family DNA-binding protein [Actinomycetales bacterium]
MSRAAALLGCSDMTIRRRIAARQFPAVRIGRKSLVPRSFVEGLLAQAEAGRTVVVDELATEWVDDTNHAALLDGEQGQARGGATGIERKASRS